MQHYRNAVLKNSNLTEKTSFFQQKYLSFYLSVVMMGMAGQVLAAEETDTAQVSKDLPIITVYANQEPKKPETVTQINRDNLDKLGAGSMSDIVKYLPLVTAPKAVSGGGSAWDGAGTSGYNIRGVDGNRIGLDVDGIDLASAAPEPASLRGNSFGVGRDYIDPEMFSEIEIASGTSSVEKDGIGGRVSFKTKSSEDYLSSTKQFGGSFKNGYSSADDAWFSALTAAAGNETVKALVAYAHRDGHETKSEGKLAENPVDWTSDAILAKALWNFTSNQQLGFTFDYYKRNVDRFIDSQTLGRTYPRGGSQNEVAERSRYALDYVLKSDAMLLDRLSAQVYYQKTTNDNLMNAFYLTYPRKIQNNFSSEVWGLNAQAQKTWKNHQFNYGFDASQSKDDRPWISTNLTTGAVTNTNFMVASDTQKYAAYFNDTMTFNVADRDLQVIPGLRAEYQKFDPKNTSTVLLTAQKQDQVQTNSSHYVAPNFAISYQLSPDYYSYFKYNRGVRVPSATEMAGSYNPGRGYSVIGNTELKKETSDAFELGLKMTPIEGIGFNISGFYTKYHNFVDYAELPQALDRDMFTYQLQNIANVNIWGAELSTRVDLGQFIDHADGFSLALVAGKTKGNAKNSAGDKTNVNSVQPEKASFTFGYDAPEHVFGLGLTATAVGSKLATQDASIDSSGNNYRRVAGYSIYDLSSYWNITKFMKINLNLNNIFDKKYWEYATVGTLTSDNLIDRATMPGRNVVASLEFKF
ncbi:TonB-dependent hemoglobin/transferrin/lactoferrin family receptor [Acinetobacter sp. MD2]|uniref:TonB-dependent hemoglobin/transferrin/lactoferrin family receptor n=1 Tax=Acinetobacter sp. MD2 TaxID=2600066 RepID=UPI002D1F6DF4|nr:TonB-dependent hemoglobin/transferrin/lactoferrin family receptor [Acinetobacter sp. MD2]MEB3767850.1 TonB-dependent hemoglobin/transferrin/lactoferrin family receptor [Acinetobacter sp. MD2]